MSFGVKSLLAFVDPMMEYQIFIGLNDKDLHYQIIDDRAAVAWIGEMFPAGCTISRNQGLYLGEAENSLTVTVYAPKSEKSLIHAAAEKLRIAFNQNQVILTVVKGKKNYLDLINKVS